MSGTTVRLGCTMQLLQTTYSSDTRSLCAIHVMYLKKYHLVVYFKLKSSISATRCLEKNWFGVRHAAIVDLTTMDHITAMI